MSLATSSQVSAASRSVSLRSAAVAATSSEAGHRVRLKVTGSVTATERNKLQNGAAKLEEVISRHEFLQELKARFGSERGTEIYERIVGGAERLSPTRDREADLQVAFFNPSFRRRNTVALSSSDRSTIHLNRKLFPNRDTADLARTLGHMQAFKLGFDSKVATAVGQIVERLARRPAPNVPSTPTPAPAPTPTPSVPQPSGPSQTVSTEAIFTAFKQGGTGNCVSIAAIKAGMARFGPDQVFRSLTRSAGGYDIVMRDGAKVRVSDAELQTATEWSEIKSRDEGLTRKANLMFAAMAKRAQNEGNDGRRNMSFTQACKTLNNGENYREGPHWLGLDDHVRDIKASELHKYTAYVAASTKHAMFGSGNYIDHYGTRRGATNSNGVKVDGYGRQLRWAFALV